MQMWKETSELTLCWLFCRLYFALERLQGNRKTPWTVREGIPKLHHPSREVPAHGTRGTKQPQHSLLNCPKLYGGKIMQMKTRHRSGLSPATDGEEDDDGEEDEVALTTSNQAQV